MPDLPPFGAAAFPPDTRTHTLIAGAGPDALAGPDVPATHVAPDAEAGAGAVSWLSERSLAADPSRYSSFDGALLIAPLAARDLAPPPCTVVFSTEPRLAFSRLVAAHVDAGPAWPAYDGPVPPDARIDPSARLARGVVLGAGVEIGPGATVGPNTALCHTTLGAGVAVGASCTLGGDGFGYTRDPAGRLVAFPHVGRVVVEDGVTIGSGTCIDRGALGETRIGAGTKIDNLVHIAHNVRLGRDCVVIAHAVVAGSVTVGDRAWIAPGALVRNGLIVGAGATVGMGAVVVKPVEAGETVAGNPARGLRFEGFQG